MNEILKIFRPLKKGVRAWNGAKTVFYQYVEHEKIPVVHFDCQIFIFVRSVYSWIVD